MQSKEIKYGTWLFAGIFLLAGFANMLTRTDNLFFNSVMFTLNFTLYIGLLLFWMQSVRQRLLPTRARTYMLSAALLMLIYLLLRVYKYRVANTAVLTRYTSYAYYIPMMLIPAFFLMTCIYIRRGERLSSGREALLLIPASILSLMVLTNDLHGFVYIPKVSLAEFNVDSGTYTYGAGFYLLYIWMIASVLIGVVLLFLPRQKRSVRRLFALSAVLFAWFGTALLTELVFIRLDLVRPYSGPEIHIFGMLGVFEVCIRQRLVPYNENYGGFFRSMQIPAVITDRSLNPAFVTAQPLSASAEKMKDSLTKAVYPAEDIRLSGKAIRSGYVFWTTDERGLRRMNDRLSEANETLDAENALIEAENKQRKELARMEFQNRVYRQISDELYPTRKRIAELLGGMQPGTEDYRRGMEYVCVLTAYVKRATNLMLMAAQSETVAGRELLLAMQESAGYLTYCGVRAEVTGKADSQIHSDLIFPLYKTFEELIEALLPHTTYLTATLSDDVIRLAADMKQLPDLPETTLPVTAILDDDMVYLTVAEKKGGGV